MNTKIQLDSTQKAICAQLEITEELMRRVGKNLTSKDIYCEITTAEDLGFSNNVMRMRGGFYTGMKIEWECDTPFIPVDATVNACGVSAFCVDEKITYDEFTYRVKRGIDQFRKDYNEPNFNVGNHFVSFCYDSNSRGYFLVIHASDNDYKYGARGLYPREDSWFFDKIKVEVLGNRYLRYISGDTACHFYSIYKKSEKENNNRNRQFATYILKGQKYRDYVYTAHYGMPSECSIAIGCQWRGNPYVLLTAFGKNIYILNYDYGERPPIIPHGFGAKYIKECEKIEVLDGKLIINDVVMPDKDLLNSPYIENRYSKQIVDETFIGEFLFNKNYRIVNTLKQLYSYNRQGFYCFE